MARVRRDGHATRPVDTGPSVVWHAYPLGILGADQTGRDRTSHATLNDLIAWLPHLSTLGADTLLLGPVFASLSHGYDTVTHREIDGRIGGLADLDALIAAASANSIGIVLDGAFAYASREFRRLTDPAEATDPWFLRTADGELVSWRVDSLVTPDYGSIGYQNYVAEVLSFWLERGIRGWRLDSAWSVPAGFWRTVLARVRAGHPDAWLLGQVFDDDLPDPTDRATYSSTTEYALMHGIREWLAGPAVDGPAVKRMVSALGMHQHNSTRKPVHTFVGNHDFARLADVVSPHLIPAAFAVLLTVPGIPAIYYGDEFALTSAWTRGGPDALLRPPLPADTPHTACGPARHVLDTVRRLGRFRHDNAWLTSAMLDDVRAHGGALTYRVAAPERSIRVYVNPTDAPVVFAADGDRQPVLGCAEIGADQSVRIPPRAWAVSGSHPECSITESVD